MNHCVNHCFLDNFHDYLTLNAFIVFRVDNAVDLAIIKPMANKIKTKRNAQIEKLSNEGYSLSEIAQRFGITRERVRVILEQRKQYRKQFRRLSKLKEEQGF